MCTLEIIRAKQGFIGRRTTHRKVVGTTSALEECLITNPFTRDKKLELSDEGIPAIHKSLKGWCALSPFGSRKKQT